MTGAKIIILMLASLVMLGIIPVISRQPGVDRENDRKRQARSRGQDGDRRFG